MDIQASRSQKIFKAASSCLGSWNLKQDNKSWEKAVRGSFEQALSVEDYKLDSKSEDYSYRKISSRKNCQRQSHGEDNYPSQGKGPCAERKDNRKVQKIQ